MLKFLAVSVLSLLFASFAMADSEYRHIVLFSFKDDASREAIAKVEKAFAALPEKIDTIQDFEWGTNVSPEGKAKGFTHCFMLTFKDKAGLEVYIPHEAHKAFGAGLKDVIKDVLVIDYVAK